MPWMMKVTSKGTRLFASKLQNLGTHAALLTASGQHPTRSGWLAVVINCTIQLNMFGLWTFWA